MSQTPSARTGYALSLSAALTWASTSILIKYLLDMGAPRLALAFWRDALIAGACLLSLALLRPQLLRARWRDLRQLALFGVISIGVYHALWVISIAMNGAAVATVLIYTYPTFVTLGAWLVFREPIRRSQVLALVIALLGCALVVRAYDPAVLRVSWAGILIGLVTGITHACYVLFSQRSVQSYSPWTSLTYTMLFGALSLLVMNLIAAPTQIFALGQGAAPWLLTIVLALGPTLGGYALFTAALRHTPGRTASLLSVIEAPASALLAVLLLGEQMQWPQIAGMLLVLLAIGLPQLLDSQWLWVRRIPAAPGDGIAELTGKK